MSLGILALQWSDHALLLPLFTPHLDKYTGMEEVLNNRWDTTFTKHGEM